MVTSLLQYWLETSLGLLLFWGWYLLFVRRRPGATWRKPYLILTPFLALSIPLMEWKYAVPGPKTGLSSLIEGWRSWLELHFGDVVQISGVTLLSMAYFGVASILLFRLADRLAATWQSLGASSPLSVREFSLSDMPGLTAYFSAAFWGLPHPGDARLKELMVLRLRIWHVFEVLVLEGGLALFWFQPLLFLFRNEVRATHLPVPAARLAGGGGAKSFLPVTGLAVLLFWLFAADQVCRWPQWFWLESRTHSLQAQLEHPLVRIGKPREEVLMWGWGGYWNSMVPLHADSITLFPVRVLSPFEFYSIFQQDWTWQKGGWKEDLGSLEALALFPYQVEPVRLDSWVEVRNFLSGQRFTTDMTLLVKMRDLDGQEWLGAVGVSEKERLYGFKNVLQTWGPGMPFLQWRKGKDGRPLAELLPHSPYAMTWGDLRLPLDLRANPSVYQGYMALDLEEFERLIDQPIRFYHNDSLLLPETVWINESDAHVISNRYSFPVRRTRRDSTETYLEPDGLQLRPAVTWTINARLPGEVEVNAIHLYIRDTDSHYDPSLWAPALPRVDSLFTFQLITRDEPPSVVRMDTTLARNRKIVDMYQSNPTYRIVHIPGFETFDRLIQLPGEIMQLIRDEGLPRDSIFQGDACPELPYGDLQNAYMEWGDLFAAPNSKVYALEEFLAQSRMKPQIRLPGRHVDIQSFVLYVFRDDKPLHAEWFSPGRVAGWDADSLAYWIRPKTSLFIDQLVVADTSGRLLSVPLAFAFHIGKSERDIRWKVVLEEISAGESGEKEPLEEEQALRFRNYRLSELIPQLIPYPANRMEFRGLDHDPVLHMELVADGPLPARAREFMLQELQKRYRFEISLERLARPNWRLHLNDADLLNRSAYEGAAVPEDRIRVFRWDGTHVLTAVTLQELAYHLEDRFDEIMEWFPNAFINDRYSFSLDCSSLSAVQFQLEAEYGIIFQRMDTLWQGIVVRFY